MPWPINPESLRDFAAHYDEVMVVEEKRPLVEDQLARAVVNMTDRAVITGKLAPDGSPFTRNRRVDPRNFDGRNPQPCFCPWN